MFCSFYLYLQCTARVDSFHTFSVSGHFGDRCPWGWKIIRKTWAWTLQMFFFFCSFVGGFYFFFISYCDHFLWVCFWEGWVLFFVGGWFFLLLFSAAVDILLLLILLSSSHSVTHLPPCSIIPLQISAQPTAPLTRPACCKPEPRFCTPAPHASICRPAFSL